MCVNSHAEHSFQTTVTETQWGTFEVKYSVRSFTLLSHGAQEACTGQRVGSQPFAFLTLKWWTFILVTGEQVNMSYDFIIIESADGR